MHCLQDGKDSFESRRKAVAPLRDDLKPREVGTDGFSGSLFELSFRNEVEKTLPNLPVSGFLSFFYDLTWS